MLSHLKEEYDWLLIDTPPLLAVTDPAIVASIVQMPSFLLFDSGRTHACSQLKRLRFSMTLRQIFFGTVVNGVDEQKGRLWLSEATAITTAAAIAIVYRNYGEYGGDYFETDDRSKKNGRRRREDAFSTKP